MSERKKPQGFVIYESTLKLLSTCTPIEAGKAMIAAAELFLSGELPTELDRASEIVFNAVKADIVTALNKYERTCETNRANRNKGMTNGDEP